MPVVRIKEGESFETALRRFKKQCEKVGILTEVRKREHYEKPSVKKKRKLMAAQKRLQKKLMKDFGGGHSNYSQGGGGGRSSSGGDSPRGEGKYRDRG